MPDFPKPGIVFKDFTPLLADPRALALAVELMANPFRGMNVDLVVGAESRGFIFGIAIAQALSAGFVPVRKPGKLPRKVRAVDYSLEYGKDRLEIHADAILPNLVQSAEGVPASWRVDFRSRTRPRAIHALAS